MGAFNILHAQIPCPACGKQTDVRIQFKFGDTWQLEYKIGDRIGWGGNATGKPGLPNVKVSGSLETTVCDTCSASFERDEFDVLVQHDVIIGVREMEDPAAYFTSESDYVEIE
ncbi:hypothetical protein [Chitinophaga caseinilytica]|uniref:Uncharacterized protein n=1 Tax=Chitinophaga caseinilytica TaxID=2267521 RepID=A0ABZ2YX89_9BACT